MVDRPQQCSPAEATADAPGYVDGIFGGIYSRCRMPLAPGTRLDAYELVARLGSGGMGEVWLARDHKLNRKVALKVLPQDLMQDPSRVARLQQEARAASALNHPNVCTIYALGETPDGQQFIAMEFVEGETLRQRQRRTDLLASRGTRCRRADRIGAECGARRRRGAPRREARKRDGPARRTGQSAGLRAGEARAAGSGTRGGAHDTSSRTDRLGRGGRDRRLHVSRAGPWGNGGRTHGCLVTWRPALRACRGPPAVRRPKQQRGARRNSRARACAFGAVRCQRAARAATNRKQDPAKGPGAALSGHEGPAARRAGVARRGGGADQERPQRATAC